MERQGGGSHGEKFSRNVPGYWTLCPDRIDRDYREIGIAGQHADSATDSVRWKTHAHGTTVAFPILMFWRHSPSAAGEAGVEYTFAGNGSGPGPEWRNAMRGSSPRKSVIVLAVATVAMLLAGCSGGGSGTSSGGPVTPGAALFVSLGAFLFWISDLMLAWNKFVTLLASGRLPIIVTYQVGQICLIAGVIIHSGSVSL